MGGGRSGGQLASDPESQMMLLYIQLQLYCAHAELTVSTMQQDYRERRVNPKKLGTEMASSKLLGKISPTFCQVLVVLYLISEKLFRKLLLHCRCSLKGHNIPILSFSTKHTACESLCFPSSSTNMLY